MVPVLVAASMVQASASDPVLLALSPVLDGRLVAEEWLPLNESGYFQWEPGKLHFAATVKQGHDLVVSLDLDGDGWLNGKDNREVRLKWSDGKVVATARTLDATRRDGPEWITAPMLTIDSNGSQTPEGWSVECSLLMGRSFAEGKSVGVHMAQVASNATTGDPFLPRPLRHFTLGFDSTENAPEGLTFKTDARLREVAREDGLNVRFELRGVQAGTAAMMRAEGLARQDLSVVSQTFPVTGSRMTGAFEYSSPISKNALSGWRVLQAQVGQTVLRTSFKVADLIELDVDLPESVPFSLTDRSVKGHINVRSTGVGRIEGTYDVSIDPAWSIKRGGTQRVLIYNPRGRERVNLDFTVPGGSQGEFPVTFTVSVGGQMFTRTVLVAVLPPGGARPGQ